MPIGTAGVVVSIGTAGVVGTLGTAGVVGTLAMVGAVGLVQSTAKPATLSAAIGISCSGRLPR